MLPLTSMNKTYRLTHSPQFSCLYMKIKSFAPPKKKLLALQQTIIYACQLFKHTLREESLHNIIAFLSMCLNGISVVNVILYGIGNLFRVARSYQQAVFI